MITICNPGTVSYPEKFKIGDVAICKKAFNFCDKTQHKVGQKINVDKWNVSYYNVFHADYDHENNNEKLSY